MSSAPVARCRRTLHSSAARSCVASPFDAAVMGQGTVRDHLGDAVAVEIGNHVRGVDPSAPVGRSVKEAAVTAENIDVVVGGDELVGAVTVEIGDDRRGEPARLAVEVVDEDRRLDRSAARSGCAHGWAGSNCHRRCGQDHNERPRATNP